jgi:Ni/Fe-hydrogenase 1 B-type cytochrome subunit
VVFTLERLIQPLPIRIFHWLMVVEVTILVLTGLLFYTNTNKLQLPFRVIRLLHGTAGVALMANLLGHTYYYIVTRRYREIVLNIVDFHNLKAFLAYFLFLRSDHPNFGRYNPGQKLIYDSWALASLLSALAGFVLLFPSESTALQFWLGGLPVLRLLKYGIMIWFIVTVPVHIYLVFTEDPAKLQAIFTGYVKESESEPSLPFTTKAAGTTVSDNFGEVNNEKP